MLLSEGNWPSLTIVFFQLLGNWPHSSSGTLSAALHRTVRGFAQNDSFEEFFRSLLMPHYHAQINIV
jgi:hypothetical protein